MLDSDSDYEYPDNNGAQSDASNDDALMGKIALGVDRNDMKSYDGRSTPTNGSQYLLKVMAEKKTFPKVAYADPSKLPVVLVTKPAVEISGPVNPNYLERFLQMCSAYEKEGQGADHVNLRLLPSANWRDEGISSFSRIRSRIDYLRHQIESHEIFLDKSIKLPQNNNHLHWQKFCFGSNFATLVSTHKFKTPEQKLNDFFIDLYDPTTNFYDQTNDAAASVKTVNSCGDQNEIESNDLANQMCELELANDTEKDDETESTDSTPCRILTPSSTADGEIAANAKVVLGHRPLMNLVMRLNQTEIENLVKWNLLWVRDFGFVNECQGQWLYAILACLSKPIDPSVMSDLRNTTRVLITLRNSVSKWNSHFDVNCDNTAGAKNSSSDSTVDEKIFDFINTLNLFIYIVADYFQQKDLVMHV